MGRCDRRTLDGKACAVLEPRFFIASPRSEGDDQTYVFLSRAYSFVLWSLGEAARDFAWMGPQKLARGSQQLTFRISVITEAQSDG